jgi:hypothetical protein
MTASNSTSSLGDSFDRIVRGLEGRPGVVKTKPTTLRVVHPVLMDASGSYRIALPAQVADTIARQRDALVTKNRRKGARRAVETRQGKAR